MKFNLLSSVSSLAFGGLLAIGATNAAYAGPLTAADCDLATGVCTAQVLGTGNGALQIPQYNAALTGGDLLTSVVITESGSFTAVGTVSYSGSGTVPFTVGAHGTLTLQQATGGGSPSFSALVVSAGKSQSYSLSSGGSGAFSQTGIFGAKGGSITGAANFGLVSGAGTFPVSVLAGFSTGLGGSGSGNAGIKNTINYTFYPIVTITYDFVAPAPEPASMALLGGGLVALGSLRRRRKAR